MLTFLAGGTGTPKLLDGLDALAEPAQVTVVGNTGDDVELAGHLVCPDLDTVLFQGGDVLDRERWWGIDGDSTATHDELGRLAGALDIADGPRYLDDDAQVQGRDIARWRRFSGVAEFMEIGDRDRAVHLTRTGLLDEGRTLTDVTRALADVFDLDVDLLPMTDDPVATIVHTDEGPMHFQEYWVWRGAEPAVESVEFRGAEDATVTEPVQKALSNPVVIGPSNPVTSIGPMLAVPGMEATLESTPVVAVSPFIEDRVFSGPAAKLMRGVGLEPSTRGVAEAYSFADAFVLDVEDGTELDRPVLQTDTRLQNPADAERVLDAVREALSVVRGETA